MAEKTKTETAPSAAPATIKVRVVKQAVSEGGQIYKKGETLELDPARVEALGELVVPATAK